MTDLNVLQTLLVGHVWQSVALAGLLAAVLILGRRMPGGTRYTLASVAFVAAIALPLAAFIPGESMVRTVLNQMNAPQVVAEAPAKAPQSLLRSAVLRDEPGAVWAVDYAANAVNEATQNGAIPVSKTEAGKAMVESGTPAWAVDLGGKILQSALTPEAAQPAPPPKPAFTLPEFKLPDFNLPDLTLPLLMVWAAGAIFLLVRTGRDLLAVERLVARARPADLPEALRIRMAGVRVAISNDAPGPMAAGLLRPCVVLPESIALASPGMAALLEHERAHIERSDMVIALLQRIVLALLWWSPALHWISRRLDEEREVACDERAVERTGDAKAFARSLTKQAENQLWARAPRLAVGAIGPRSQVGRRIKRLIEIAKGAAPAKYAGRLAFAGLALAVAVAAMVTPRFSADAQQTKDIPPVDDSLAGGPSAGDPDSRGKGFSFSWNDNDSRTDQQRLDQLAGAPKGTGDLGVLMEQLGIELETAFSGLSPELEGELAGLSTEMAALGAEISVLVGQQMSQEMPRIMEEVRKSLAEEGIIVTDWDDMQQLTGIDQEALREAIEDARNEIHNELGPEMRAEIRAALDSARAELSEHRDEIRAALEQNRMGMEAAREAMSKVREELNEARARGDFDKLKNFHFDPDIDIDIDKQVLDQLRDMGINAKGAKVMRIKGDDLSKDERLFRAAGRGDVDAVRDLIENDKANVNAVLRGDGTPLIAAARRGKEDVVRLLLSSGANPNLASPGDGNPLIAAASRGEIDIVRLLIDRGAKVNGPAPGDGNALIAAAQRGEIDVVRLLLDRGADVNAYVEGDETPLMNAAEQGELEIVKLLVDRGAKVNLAYNVKTWRDDSDRTELRSPLNIAQKHDQDDVADYLRSKGAVANPKAAN